MVDGDDFLNDWSSDDEIGRSHSEPARHAQGRQQSQP
jgi:hypothetical protein